MGILLLLFIILAIFLTRILATTKQDIRKKAAGSSATISLYPTKETFQPGETKIFELKATFLNGSKDEKLDYFKTEISFSPKYLQIPAKNYIQTSTSGFNRIFKIDGPENANKNGRIIIKMGTDKAGNGPTTLKPLTLARIYFQGKEQTPSIEEIGLENTQVVNNRSAEIPSTLQGVKYRVGQEILPTSTPTPTLNPIPSIITPAPTRVPNTCSTEADCPRTMDMEWPRCNLVSCTNNTCIYGTKQNGTVCTTSNSENGICLNGKCVTIITPTPKIVGCNQFCLHYNLRCTQGLECLPSEKTVIGGSVCRNPKCPDDPLCACEEPPPTISPESCLRKIEGDANCDGSVDGIDYSLWLNIQCHPKPGQICSTAIADFNGDGNTDDRDFDIWFNNRGT